MKTVWVLRIVVAFLSIAIVALVTIAMLKNSDSLPLNETAEQSPRISNPSQVSAPLERSEHTESSSSSASDNGSHMTKDETANTSSLEKESVMERDREHTESSSSSASDDGSQRTEDTAVQNTEELRQQRLQKVYDEWESTDTVKALGILQGNVIRNNFKTVLDDGTILKYYRIDKGDLIRETIHPDGAVEKTIVKLE